MKKLLILSLSVCSIIFLPAYAAEPFEVVIVKRASMDKSAIFDGAVLWMAENFKSSKEVIDMKDKDIGVIVGNGVVDVKIGWMVKNPFSFKLKLDVKDKKYRMTFKDVQMVLDGYEKPIENTNRKSTEPKVKEKFEVMAESLNSYLSIKKNDNW